MTQMHLVHPRPDAVLFDCDGVIADSETVIARVLAEEITALGWPMTVEEEQKRFQGMTGAMLNEALVARVGPLPEGWRKRVGQRISAALHAELEPVPGVIDAIRSLHAHGVPMAVASNSGREELHYKIAHLGLTEIFAGRVFSHQDVAQPKPAPDLYLAAASSCGMHPARCAVVEDTAMGIRAGIAAGCRVLGYARHETPGLRESGAELFTDMSRLPRLLGFAEAS